MIWRHAMKPAMLPVVSYLGPTFVAMITGSVVIDVLFLHRRDRTGLCRFGIEPRLRGDARGNDPLWRADCALQPSGGRGLCLARSKDTVLKWSIAPRSPNGSSKRSPKAKRSAAGRCGKTPSGGSSGTMQRSGRSFASASWCSSPSSARLFSQWSIEEIDWARMGDIAGEGHPSMESGHYFGLDGLGRDLYSRTISGDPHVL